MRSGTRHVLKALLLTLAANVAIAASAAAQPPADCKPNALNIPGAPYPCVLPDHRVMFRVAAPDAQKVRVRVGAGFDMAKAADGLWHVTTTPQVIGFHYYTIRRRRRGADPRHALVSAGMWNSAIEVPDPDGGYFAQQDVPRGRVRQRWYRSSVTGAGGAPTSTRLPLRRRDEDQVPVLYLMHGGARTSRAGTCRATST